MQITVNGRPQTVPDRLTLERLVADQGLAQTACAAEVNTILVPKAERDAHTLADGDIVELVTLVGGG